MLYAAAQTLQQCACCFCHKWTGLPPYKATVVRGVNMQHTATQIMQVCRLYRTLHTCTINKHAREGRRPACLQGFTVKLCMHSNK